MEVKGYGADVKGYGVDVKGYVVDVKGYDVDVKGYGVDVKGYGVDVKGYVCAQDSVPQGAAVQGGRGQPGAAASGRADAHL